MEQLERPLYYSNRREREANLDLHFLSDAENVKISVAENFVDRIVRIS